MELDDAYANLAYIPDGESYPARWYDAARKFTEIQSGLGRAQLGIQYGDSGRQRLDLFYPEASPIGLLVFVHGGYWLKFDRSYWSHLSAGAIARGWAVAMPSYDLCPDVRISRITQQIRIAVQVAAAMVPGPLALAGHSAGGHLAARMLAPGALNPSVAARLRHVVPISPVADLRPLLKTSMNADLHLNLEEATAESPINQPVPDVPVTVWVGADERPAFLDQARWLAEAWSIPCTVAPDRHHFDVIDLLADPDSDLVLTLTQ